MSKLDEIEKALLAGKDPGVRISTDGEIVAVEEPFAPLLKAETKIEQLCSDLAAARAMREQACDVNRDLSAKLKVERPLRRAAEKERDEAQAENAKLCAGFDAWQDRFCALSEAWDTGDNETVLEAVRKFVKAADGDAAGEKARELKAFREERDEAEAKVDRLCTILRRVRDDPAPDVIDRSGHDDAGLARMWQTWWENLKRNAGEALDRELNESR